MWLMCFSKNEYSLSRYVDAKTRQTTAPFGTDMVWFKEQCICACLKVSSYMFAPCSVDSVVVVVDVVYAMLLLGNAS